MLWCIGMLYLLSFWYVIELLAAAPVHRGDNDRDRIC